MNAGLSSATAAQVGAADPDRNVWLVANAGSGKTKVLTDRVARLLLRGTSPQNILCLTYTKAAAAEMQNRLFRRLGEWAMASDAALRDNLAALGETGDLPGPGLARARQLFARAIETPGGIRIQTIHSFCAGILRRFPLEAGVSPSFVELDDRTAALLRENVFEAMAEGPDRAVLDAVLEPAGEQVDGLLAAITGRRADLARVPDRAAMARALDLPPGLTEARLVDDVFGPGGLPLLRAITPHLRQSDKVTDHKLAKILDSLPETPDLTALQKLEGPLLYGDSVKTAEPFSAKVGKVPTSDCRKKLGPMADGLDDLMRRLEDARPLRLGLRTLRRAMALHRFAAAYVARYEAAKSARGWLDFDDLITRATAVLTDPGMAPWVLFRLDGAIDHILVDEAQDTSPAQWQIIEALTQEFTAGQGARDGLRRSLFVVGDKKQSIYSFQGADVAGFDSVRQIFAARFEGAREPITDGRLRHSFRSSGAILSLVDRCFPGALSVALGGAFEHVAHFDTLPGRVDIWPPVPKPDKPEPKDWFDPVDQVTETDADVVLATRIAAEIRAMLDAGTLIPQARGGARRMHAGDVLILVQRRGALFTQIIRACKAQDLPIAGADRMTLTQELSVRDILALLAFLNTPEDDLSLATVLRSALFGWSEARLYALAHGRPGYLWERLRSQGGPEVEVIQDLLGQAEFLRPYELIERVLTRHGARERLLGRMGPEAADAIDELQAQALAYERTEVPSLTGFLVWMSAGEVVVKRQAEGEGHVIRVMTVHGAKGLEAPVVILPETADRDLRERDQILPLAPGLMTWTGSADTDPPAVTLAKIARAEARIQENLRLLYVAMTRAKCWLIVAAAGTCTEKSWHEIIRQGAAAPGSVELDITPLPEGRLRLSLGDWPVVAEAVAPDTVVAPQSGTALADLPPAPVAPVQHVASDLGGDKALPAEAGLWAAAADGALPAGAGDVRARGTALHALLERLAGTPADGWPALAARLGADAGLLAEATAILSDPALGWLFAPGTLAEVEVALPVTGGVLTGSIDRLVVGPDRVVVVDYKSNALVPDTPQDVPEGYLRQLGAYAAAVAAIYPGRQVETAILWTRIPHRLMPLPLDIVRGALSRAATAWGGGP